MINHVWTVLCSGSSIDSETNTISIFQVIEQLRIVPAADPCPEEIVVPVPFEIFSLWVRKDPAMPARGKARVFYCFPNDVCSKTSEYEIDLEKTVLHRTRIRSQGIKVHQSGLYTFYVELQNDGETEWTRVATIPLLVEITKQEPKDPAQTEQPE